jgi:hypothetical protein
MNRWSIHVTVALCVLSGCSRRDLSLPSQGDEAKILRAVIDDIETLRLSQTCLISVVKSSPWSDLENVKLDDGMRWEIAKSWDKTPEQSQNANQRMALETAAFAALKANPMPFPAIKTPQNSIPQGVYLSSRESKNCTIVYRLSRPAVLDGFAFVEVAWNSNPIGAGQGQTFALKQLNRSWKIVAKRVSFLN